MQENLSRKRLLIKSSLAMPELSEDRPLHLNTQQETDSNANHVTPAMPQIDLDFDVDDPDRMQSQVCPNLPDYYLDSMGLKYDESDSARYVKNPIKFST